MYKASRRPPSEVFSRICDKIKLRAFTAWFAASMGVRRPPSTFHNNLAEADIKASRYV